MIGFLSTTTHNRGVLSYSVYRATDTNLGRSVAIKILPEAFARDAERVSRFQREAQVLAALNHSNIASIYDLQAANDSRFLVMELVEGETLADRIAKGPLPVHEALHVAKQICEALEAAHEKGIIHRDLKPANIKVTPDGKVKVLDFGLAKAYEREKADETLSNSPTLSMAATNAGVILGTAAYMSPEQARGKEVDRRTDIFAFGSVLYEMLTGRQAFIGEDVADILGAVLKSEPDWTRLPSSVPPRIRELLRLCLQKDAKKRRQTATDVRIDIEQVLTEPAAAILASAPTRSSRLAWTVAALAALGMIALAVPTVRYLRETPPAPPETRLDIVTPATNDPISFALSPDGRQLVFVASGDGASRLWLRSLASTSAQPLAGTEGAAYPFWSPDSRLVGFFADNKLKRIDISGGLPQTLAAVSATRGGTWSSDGVILFTPSTNSPLFRVSASGGQAVAVTKLEKHASHRFPQFLPSGRQFLFYALGPSETQGIYLGALDAPETKRLTAAGAAGVYDPAGWLLFIRGGTLLAQRLDLTRQELIGDPVTVADPVAFDANGSAVSVSAAGLVAYRGGVRVAALRQLKWYDRTGKAMGVAGEPDSNLLNYPELSSDGRRAAVGRNVQNPADVWLMDLVRGGLTRFTFDPANDVGPVWSPDGMRIAFASARKGPYNLYLKPSSGAAAEELLLDTPNTKYAQDWSKDGRFLLYSEIDAKTRRDLWALPITGNDRKPIVVVKTPFEELNGQFSPDGRWVAYETNESGRFEIVVQPFPTPSGKWQVSTAGGIQPRWRADGKELYFIAPDGKLMAASITTTGATFAAATAAMLFSAPLAPGGTASKQQYAVSRDGRFLLNQPAEASTTTTTTPITLILNWKPKP